MRCCQLARVAIDELKMHGVPGGFQLNPGMTVTADIKAGERTSLTNLFARMLPVGLEAMREVKHLVPLDQRGVFLQRR
jgi:membrane fusion protein, hemolysin D